MPRRKTVDKHARERSLRACTHCRRRKEKCDGEDPCAQCAKRSLDCRYIAVGDEDYPLSPFRSSELRASAQAATPSAEGSDRQPGKNTSATSGVGRPRSHRLQTKTATTGTEAPVPRSARLLSGGHGTLIYIGDSASVSFVQNVRRIVSLKIGDCEFTNDRYRHSFVEQGSSMDMDEFSWLNSVSPTKPQMQDIEVLVDNYLIATSCVLDICDKTDLLEAYRCWTDGLENSHGMSDAFLYLILAIGAQARKNHGSDREAERFLNLAQRFTSATDNEEPSMQMVQCHLLLAMYRLGGSRRNASYMNLGVAVRAAYALGLHRGDLSSLFSASDRRSRERTWRSLRVMDVFLSASLGRPPSTSDFEGHESAEEVVATQNSNTKVAKEPSVSEMAAALSRLCPIFEKILFSVYKKQGVSPKVVDDISTVYHKWTEQLPQMPIQKEGIASLNMSQTLGSLHVLGAYYWSIILLTRPFLLFQISQKTSSANQNERRAQRIPSAAIFAESCIDSALKAIELISARNYADFPRRVPFVLNLVFNSALAIGAAFFGDYDRSMPLEDAMDKAEQFLQFLQPDDSQAERYAQIISHLRAAAKQYTVSRDLLSRQRHRQLNSNLFGDVGYAFTQTDSLTADAPRGQQGSQSTPGNPYAQQTGAQASVADRHNTAISTTASQKNYQDTNATWSGELQQSDGSLNNEFSPDMSVYDFTVPTNGLMNSLGLGFEEASDFSNFLMPMFPSS